jgi:hypothetical protein
MITSRLRQRLQDQSPDLYARLQVLENKAHQLAEYSQAGANLTFTPHGLSHISTVEANYDWLLPDADIRTFNPSEVYCLLGATLFHDVLMVPRRQGLEAQSRDTHAESARDFLLQHRDVLGLSVHESDAIGEVIRGHGVNDLGSIQPQVVLRSDLLDLRKLAACLSLSDLLHADASRAPEIVFRHLQLDEDSQLHWRKHLQVSGITRKDDSIIMSALTFSEYGDQAVEDYRLSVEKQLSVVRPYFHTVLSPIQRVELISKRLESPLHQALTFETNTPAILRLLIEGVYDREDVFIRELVQNSLDACLLARLKHQRRTQAYSPKVVITAYFSGDRLKAVRVDDNGIGMDINDVQDTVLWIGNSISARADLTDLLQEQLGQRLIATFGIGLLSCFKVSRRIQVRTAKERATPLEFTLTGVSDTVRPEKASDATIGTTIIVELKDDHPTDVNVDDAAAYYFRAIRQAELSVLTLQYSPTLLGYTREAQFTTASTESQAVTPYTYATSNDGVTYEIVGDDYSGCISLPGNQFESIVDSEGEIDILNEGVFVVSEPSIEWLPENLDFCRGMLNFSSRSINLPAGRDRVIKDNQFRARRQQVIEKSWAIVDALVSATDKGDPERDLAALTLAYAYKRADKEWRQKCLRRVGNYRVKLFKSTLRPMLSEIAANTLTRVHVQYSRGRWVDELSIFNGKQLYHKTDDLIELQAAVMAQENEIVIAAIRNDSEATSVNSRKVALEATLVMDYLREKGIQVIDLSSENLIEGRQRSKPIPDAVRQRIQGSVKFIELPGLPNRMAWQVGSELWINVSHPAMGRLYSRLRDPAFVGTADHLEVVEEVIHLLACRFDRALEMAVARLGLTTQAT